MCCMISCSSADTTWWFALHVNSLLWPMDPDFALSRSLDESKSKFIRGAAAAVVLMKLLRPSIESDRDRDSHCDAMA